RADARDRHSQESRRAAQRHSGAVPGRINDALTDRRIDRFGHRIWHLVAPGQIHADSSRIAFVGRGAGDRGFERRRADLRNLSGMEGGETRSDRGVEGGMNLVNVPRVWHSRTRISATNEHECSRIAATGDKIIMRIKKKIRVYSCSFVADILVLEFNNDKYVYA